MARTRQRRIVRGFLGTLLAAGLILGGELAAEPGDTGAASERTGAVDARLTQTFQSPDKPEIGDRLDLLLKVTHPAETEVSVNPILDESRWRFIGTRRERVKTEEHVETDLTLSFQVFRPGKTTLPALEVAVARKGATEPTTLETEPVTVTIASTVGDVTDPSFRGPRPTRPVWESDYTLAWVGGGILAVALLGLVVLRRRDDEQTGIIEPSRPPEEVALEQLERLAASDYLAHGDYMIFYVRMSEAVRRYLGRRFGFPGTELTTAEILERLEGRAFAGEIERKEIAEWMRSVDLVKFSGRVPTDREAQEGLERAFEMVRGVEPGGESDHDHEDEHDHMDEHEDEDENGHADEHEDAVDGGRKEEV